MNVNGIQQSTPVLPAPPKVATTPGDQQSKFADVLKTSIENLNEVQLSSDQKTEALAKGEIEDLHLVMIAAQKATITLEATVQIQKKVIDAYNEVMRMQV